MKVHPLADMFPMMPEDELTELAEDIKNHGLIHPIILDDDGQLIDGRNRLKACKLAGVEPRFEKLNGQDPNAYIVSANLARRNLTKGQQAMALARIYPESGQKGRGKKDEGKEMARKSSFSHDRLNQARFILKHTPELGKAVLGGDVSFDEALEKATLAEQLKKGNVAKLDRLRRNAPDLAARVEDEKERKDRLTLDEAMDILHQRLEREAHVRAAGRAALENLTEFANHVVAIGSAMELGEVMHIPDRTWNLIDQSYCQLQQLFPKKEQR
jgi:hypothetical protein